MQEDLLVQVEQPGLGEFCAGGIGPDLDDRAKRVGLVGGDHPSDLFRAQPDPAPHRMLCVGVSRLVAPDLDVTLALAGLRNVIGRLHAHERLHIHAKCLFEA